MLQGLGRKIIFYFVFFIGILVTLVGLATYYYWHEGLGDTHYISSIYQASNNFEELNKSDLLSKVSLYALNGNQKLSVKYLGQLESQIYELDQLKKNTPSSKTLLDQLQKLKIATIKLLNYQPPMQIVKILEGKVVKFREYSGEKQWQTLSKLAMKMENKISEFKEFSPEKMKILTKSLVQDISIVKNVAETSSLNQGDINNILFRMQSLQSELNLIQNLLEDLDVFGLNYQEVARFYQTWAGEI
jgi:hypothetical protein